MGNEYPSPSSITSLILGWVSDPEVGSQALSDKIEALIELYGREVRRMESEELAAAEEALSQALESLRPKELPVEQRSEIAEDILTRYLLDALSRSTQEMAEQ